MLVKWWVGQTYGISMFRQSGLGFAAHEMLSWNCCGQHGHPIFIPGGAFLSKGRKNRTSMSSHLYDTLVSQKASPVILRLLMRKQMQDREGKVKSHWNPVLAPLPHQSIWLPGAFGQAKQAPTWRAIVPQAFWSPLKGREAVSYHVIIALKRTAQILSRA